MKRLTVLTLFAAALGLACAGAAFAGWSPAPDHALHATDSGQQLEQPPPSEPREEEMEPQPR